VAKNAHENRHKPHPSSLYPQLPGSQFPYFQVSRAVWSPEAMKSWISGFQDGMVSPREGHGSQGTQPPNPQESMLPRFSRSPCTSPQNTGSLRLDLVVWDAVPRAPESLPRPAPGHHVGRYHGHLRPRLPHTRVDSVVLMMAGVSCLLVQDPGKQCAKDRRMSRGKFFRYFGLFNTWALDFCSMDVYTSWSREQCGSWER